jgi:hypothetical protein
MNGCSAVSASIGVTVNPLPAVKFIGVTDNVCNTAVPYTLSGGSPAGGVYSGPGVSGGVFDPGAAGPGSHALTYTYTDANGCSNSATNYVFVDDCSGIEELDEFGVDVYPNPTQGVVSISSESSLIASVKVFDAAGRLVVLHEGNGQEIKVDLSRYETGIYTLEISADNQLLRTRVVKQ